MNEVYHDVEIEPLQGDSFDNNSTTTEDEARLDIKSNGVGDRVLTEFSFFDVKIFNPQIKRSRKLLKNAYKYHKTQKNSKYQQKISNVDQSSFCLLVFGCTGGSNEEDTEFSPKAN